jgi:hypothetical protein
MSDPIRPVFLGPGFRRGDGLGGAAYSAGAR